MPALELEVAPVFRPLLAPARYKGAHGGRGSGKSQFFADLMIARALREPGFRGLCGRETQKSLKESAKRLIEAKIAGYRLGRSFRIQADRIATPGGGAIVFVGLAEHGAESIKSYEGFDVAWVEEAQSVSARSLALLRPTIRAPGSELWFSWNPRRRDDPIDRLLRGAERPTGAAVVRANWSDNPWFPAELDQERRDCLRIQPDQYGHIWDGEHLSVAAGAYYARELVAAKAAGRIGRIGFDPLLTVRLFWDIGGTGARADACAIWAAQFIGREIRVRDYYEAVGQPLAAHLNWLRGKGYGPERAQIWLPHDGASNDRVFDVSYASALGAAGYAVTVVPNQGKGAAAARIEAVRRLFPNIWFDADSSVAGRDALGWYHERRDEARGLGLGPAHDWASHGADAFGLMCVAYEAPRKAAKIHYSSRGIV